MGGFRRLEAQSEASSIPAGAIQVGHLSEHTETGVGTLPPTAKYRIFTTAFGTVPNVELRLTGTTTTGTPSGRKIAWDIPRVRPGSFQWIGTPSARVRYFVQGF